MIRKLWLVILVFTLAAIGCRPNADMVAAHRDAESHAADARVPVTVAEAVSDAAPQQSLLEDVTETAGVNFKHVAGGERFFVPRSIGSGAALFDCDGDGLLDLYLIQNAGPESQIRNQLFRQQGDQTFVDISAESGLGVDGYGMGCAAGDVNNDGRVDLVLSEYGRIRMFLNQTEDNRVRFVEVSNVGLENPAWGSSLAFTDYDRDGRLDLVVANYLDYDPSRECLDAGGREDFCGPQSFGTVVARLFHNEGNASTNNDTSSSVMNVRFRDVTIESQLVTRPGKGLGVLCADFNGDGWCDIFLANDGVPNTLWINRHDGTFSEDAGRFGMAYNAMGEAQADMGVAWGDVNADGRFDLFVTHRATETHTLWSQVAPGNFVDLTPTTGITKTSWRGTGFGTALLDLDNDGDQDLAVVNGRVLRFSGSLQSTAPDVDAFWQPYAQRDQLLLNDGSGRFKDVTESNPEYGDSARVSRGLVCGDINNDGRMDLLVTCIDGPAKLYFNRSDDQQHWLVVRAVDSNLHRDAIGAHITLIVDGRAQVREINPHYSFLSSNDPRVHFGLGAASNYDAIRIVWPMGEVEDFPGGPADQFLKLERGQGQAVQQDAQAGAK
ncbi:MAG: CRTAC1 family protein [Planctomycetales bacterium]|nr:CRTAC1 family protein [Planctomycetales bacterium]